MCEIKLSPVQVQKLLERYAPDWAHFPIADLQSTGTDNALYRLGDTGLLRLPKRQSARAPLEKELLWLPLLQGLPVAVPELLWHGKSKQETGFDFGIFRWLPGWIATPDRIDDPHKSAKVLAGFLSALHAVKTGSAPKAGPDNHHRGVELRQLNDAVRSSIAILSDEIDAAAAVCVWEDACAAAPAEKAVWLHGDLKADNLIAQNGVLSAVIDWGLAAVGDAAADLSVAWTWVAPESRALFQSECQATKDDWRRAKGWALYCAVIALSYYRNRSHEALCTQSRQTLQRLGLG